MNTAPLNASELKAIAKEIGFLNIGIAKAKKLDREAKHLETWLTNSYHGEMSYMERYFDQRIDPEVMMPGTKSIITLSFNYFQEKAENTEVQIARYAYGKDYHLTLKQKAKQLIQWLETKYGNIQARAFVDSAPVMEREWAKRSGIAWSGRNTLSIHPKEGSYFFLVCIFTDLSFQEDQAMADYCGTCIKCIEACPTDAIHPDGYLLDASKCISYLTIELKNEIPQEFLGKMKDWIFGCDICQEVCPWNRFAKKTIEPDFQKNEAIVHMNTKDWLALEEESFNILTKASPLKRTKWKGLKRNVIFVKNNC